VLAPLFGLLYVLATPPFQSPDEPQHFYRAYQISELGFIGRKSADTPEPGAGGVLPRSLKVVADLVMADVPHNIRRYVDPEAVKAALRIPLQPDDREFLEFSTDVLTRPSRMPAGAAIGLGRLFHAPPLSSLSGRVSIWPPGSFSSRPPSPDPGFSLGFPVLALARCPSPRPPRPRPTP